MSLKVLYAVNATLLVVHEIDAAFWHEWQQFHLPGGVGGFLLLHIPLMLLVFWGYEQVTHMTPSSLGCSLVVAAVGLCTFGIHGVFLAQGGQEFRTATSVGLLIAIGLASLMHAALALIRQRRRLPRRA